MSPTLADRGGLEPSAVHELLRSEDTRERRAMAYSLRSSAPDAAESLGDLAPLLEDEDADVRASAERAIWWIGRGASAAH